MWNKIEYEQGVSHIVEVIEVNGESIAKVPKEKGSYDHSFHPSTGSYCFNYKSGGFAVTSLLVNDSYKYKRIVKEMESPTHIFVGEKQKKSQMKKTPLAKLIEHMESKKIYGLSGAYQLAKQLLEEERKNLIEAYDDGRKSMLKSSGLITTEQYFNENYEQ